MTRQEIKAKRQENFKKIEALKNENFDLAKQDILLSDDVQQYYEEEVEVIVNKRPKLVEKQLRGFRKWNEDFYDESSGEKITIERRELVRINGDFI